jgi:Na+-transporting NADH:ubiquinone oxidoreductase subunit NqrA
MPKKGVRVSIAGKPRRVIDVDAMTHIVIALGREFAERKRTKKRQTAKTARGVGS